MMIIDCCVLSLMLCFPTCILCRTLSTAVPLVRKLNITVANSVIDNNLIFNL